jgi:tRNA dimethylallyltransferase
MVGGSGMFIDALTIGLDDIPTDKTLREELNRLVDEDGLNSLLSELKEKDPEFYLIVDKQNPVRVIRAIEAIRLTGRPFTELRKSTKRNLPFAIRRFVIEHPREKLYERINHRVDLMMEAGLLKEVENVFPKRHLNALRTVGYTELFAYLNHEITLNEAVDLIKQNSRRYAKRQMTWFRKHQDAVWIPFDTSEKMIQNIVDELVKH